MADDSLRAAWAWGTDPVILGPAGCPDVMEMGAGLAPRTVGGDSGRCAAAGAVLGPRRGAPARWDRRMGTQPAPGAVVPLRTGRALGPRLFAGRVLAAGLIYSRSHIAAFALR